MSYLKVAFIVFEVLLIFNLIIFVHELGHFLAARWRGLKVDRFAIWFGKPLWKKKIGDVEYALGWIPAGGYVALPQMATMEAIEGTAGEAAAAPLPNVSPLDKIIVAFAGPLFSFLLALFFAVIVWQVGRPQTYSDNAPQLGWVEPDGPAWKGGLRPGDVITAIDGKPVTTFGPPSQESITWRVITSENPTIKIDFKRGDEKLSAEVTPYKRNTKWYERRALRQILVGPVQDSIVYDVATNSPADLAGLKRGDQIVSLNGESIFSPGAVMHLEEQATNGTVANVRFSVKRGSESFEAVLTPVSPVSPTNFPPAFGFTGWQGSTNIMLVHPGPWQQIKSGAMQIFATIGAIAGKSDIGVQQLGGPVMIIRVYKNLFEAPEGWRQVLWFSVVFNINLALLNMLPLPVLDGGHITLSLVEAIRRRPVSPRFLGYIQNSFAIALIGFMIYIAFFDTGDWFRSAHADREVPIVFAPKN